MPNAIPPMAMINVCVQASCFMVMIWLSLSELRWLIRPRIFIFLNMTWYFFVEFEPLIVTFVISTKTHVTCFLIELSMWYSTLLEKKKKKTQYFLFAFMEPTFQSIFDLCEGLSTFFLRLFFHLFSVQSLYLIMTEYFAVCV